MSVFSDDNGVWGMVGLDQSRFQTLSKIHLEKRTEAFYSINILVFEQKTWYLISRPFTDAGVLEVTSHNSKLQEF